MDWNWLDLDEMDLELRTAGVMRSPRCQIWDPSTGPPPWDSRYQVPARSIWYARPYWYVGQAEDVGKAQVTLPCGGCNVGTPWGGPMEGHHGGAPWRGPMEGVPGDGGRFDLK